MGIAKKNNDTPQNKKSDKEKDPLTPRQRIFLNTYLTHPDYRFNATKSFIHAGFSKECARQNAHILLNTNQYISSEVTKHLTKSNAVTREILGEIHKIATSDIKDFIELDPDTQVYKQKSLDEIPEGLTSVINEIDGYRKIAESEDGSKVLVTDTFKFKLYDKQKALSDYVKILGLAQPDKLDITSGGEKITAIDVNIKGVKIED